VVTKIKNHTVRHGDVQDREQIAEYIGERKADLFYSDPPWGEGNIKYWQTMNRKMNGDAAKDPSSTSLDNFLDCVLTYAKKYTKGFVVIEYGKRWTAQLIELAKAKGLIYCNEVEALYSGQNLPVDIIFFHTEEYKEIDLSTIYHMKGYACVKAIFALLKKYGDMKVGMDLCCGMGYTAQACLDNGLDFIGNELNEKRLEKTIARLNKKSK
jgi:hypothetical protein